MRTEGFVEAAETTNWLPLYGVVLLWEFLLLAALVYWPEAGY